MPVISSYVASLKIGVLASSYAECEEDNAQAKKDPSWAFIFLEYVLSSLVSLFAYNDRQLSEKPTLNHNLP